MKTIHPVVENHGIAAQVRSSNMAASLKMWRTPGFETKQ